MLRRRPLQTIGQTPPQFQSISPEPFMECKNDFEYEANDVDKSAETVDLQKESHEWCGFKIVGDNTDKNT